MSAETSTIQSLHSLFARLEALSCKPDFQLQQQKALSFFLQPYFTSERGISFNPLPEEVNLAKLCLYADYLPDDGHYSLIEQVRDQISEHVPEEERVWLDPLRHSYMDLLEITAIGSEHAPHVLHLRSLGNGVEYSVEGGTFSQPPMVGRVLLTRLIRRPQYTTFPGVAVALSLSHGQLLYSVTKDLQLEMEATTGAFELGDWSEFAKRYGYLLLWNLAFLRGKALAQAESSVQYSTSQGDPFLYAVALYEHHEYRHFADTLGDMNDLESVNSTTDHTVSGEETTIPSPDIRTWVQKDVVAREGPSRVVTRITLTPLQLIVECDSQARLDSIKHLLASTFGFSLHFKGETTEVPSHPSPEVDLLAEATSTTPVAVSTEEQQRLLSSFLETIYLEWAEQPSPALKGQTPRHYCSQPHGLQEVAELIDTLEKNDLARWRTGKAGYDYDILRRHVGLP